MEYLIDCLTDFAHQAMASLDDYEILDSNVSRKLDYISTNESNRSGARLVLACLAAKIDNASYDPRKPYTVIGTADAFSGRTYDESVVAELISRFGLPLNDTTAFLTPALRNGASPLVVGTEMAGRPAKLYYYCLEVLEFAATNPDKTDLIFRDMLRYLFKYISTKRQVLDKLLEDLGKVSSDFPLASEEIVDLVAKHIDNPRASRLPVLVVAAAYNVVSNRIGESIRALNAHNAADSQTGALGDIEICLEGDDKVVTVYEMKLKAVTRGDVDHALAKLARAGIRVHNYIIITTEPIEEALRVYVGTLYEKTGGIEVVIMDCIGFLRHFLHLFHRLRSDYIDEYQRLVLAEPESAVGYPLKEAFLSLKRHLETSRASEVE